MLQKVHVTKNTCCLISDEICLPVYYLDSRSVVLIDSGFPYQGDALFDFLEYENLTVKVILTSHAHIDHIGNHNRIAQKYQCQTYMTPFDAGLTQSATSLKACFYSSTVNEIQSGIGNMICKCDNIIDLSKGSIRVEDVCFKIINLPGHAASQIGFILPDGVVYLADSMASPEYLDKKKMIYMLDWKEALNTMQKLRTLDYQSAVLAHTGIHNKLNHVIDKNIETFVASSREILESLSFPSRYDEAVKTVLSMKKIKITNLKKALLMERFVRGYLDFLVDTEQLNVYHDNGIIYYDK